MIVCVCRGVSDQRIRQAIDAGATCVRQLEARCIGDRCGMCVDSLRDLIEEQTARTGEAACSQCCGVPAAATA
jgi:bacterioferritin-associated ferredoxin